MAIELRPKEHGILPGNQMVECWRDGEFVAAIYPHQDGIVIVSKYLENVYKEKKPRYSAGQWVPSAIVKLGKESRIK
jgi:hypothetical protein